jgi:hypothetical protein
MLNKFIADLQTNPRLRLWLTLIAASIGLYSLLILRDSLQSAEQTYNQTARAVGRLQTQLKQTEWPQRLVPAQALAVQLESRLWQAPTAGLAQAGLQDWLNAALTQAKVTRPQVSVTIIDEITSTNDSAIPNSAPAIDGATPPDLWKVKAKVGFDFNQITLFDFLNRLQTHDKLLVIDSLSIRKEPLAHVEIDVFAYFQKQSLTDKPSVVATAKPAIPAVAAAVSP